MPDDLKEAVLKPKIKKCGKSKITCLGSESYSRFRSNSNMHMVLSEVLSQSYLESCCIKVGQSPDLFQCS